MSSSSSSVSASAARSFATGSMPLRELLFYPWALCVFLVGFTTLVVLLPMILLIALATEIVIYTVFGVMSIAAAHPAVTVGSLRREYGPNVWNFIQVPYNTVIWLIWYCVGAGVEVFDETQGVIDRNRPVVALAQHPPTVELAASGRGFFYLPGPWRWVVKDELLRSPLSLLVLPMILIGAAYPIDRGDRKSATSTIKNIPLLSGSGIIFADKKRPGYVAWTEHALSFFSRVEHDPGYARMRELLGPDTVREWDLPIAVPSILGPLALLRANPNAQVVLQVCTFRDPVLGRGWFTEMLSSVFQPFSPKVYNIPITREQLGFDRNGNVDQQVFGAKLIQLWLNEVFPRLKANGVKTAYEIGYRAPEQIRADFADLFTEDGKLRPVEFTADGVDSDAPPDYFRTDLAFDRHPIAAGTSNRQL